MDLNQLNGSREQFNGERTGQNCRPTDDECRPCEGNDGKCVCNVQERYGKKKSTLMEWAHRWRQQSAPEAWGSHPTEWMRFTRDE